jgi:hypothetical protein
MGPLRGNTYNIDKGHLDRRRSQSQEAQEQEPDPAALEEGQEYLGDEPREDGEEAGGQVEEGEGEGEDEGEDGGHPAPPTMEVKKWLTSLREVIP